MQPLALTRRQRQMTKSYQIYSTFFCLIIFFFGGVASASDVASQMLFSKGAWSVHVGSGSDPQNIWCSAETSNKRGQNAIVAAYNSGDLVLIFTSPSWRLSKRNVRFLVDVDYSRWTVDGSAENNSVSIHMNDTEAASNFLREVSNGNAIALYNQDERKLATFSLSGSSAAVRSLFECWTVILEDSDPFGPSPSQNKPVSTEHDPF